MSPVLAKLLILQDRDGKRMGLEAQLKTLPRDIAAVEQKIATEKAEIENAKAEARALEAKKKVLETEIGSAEEKVAKYKTQQMSVRKNDEYQALGHEIDTTQTSIGTLEEEEIGVMLAIDEAKKKFTEAEKVLKTNIVGHETRIKNFREREVNLVTEVKAAQADVASARQPIEEPAIRLYDRVSQRSFPACVPIRSGKCGGCHLKVSSDVESESRKNDKLATCDQCGRIVWWDV